MGRIRYEGTEEGEAMSDKMKVTVTYEFMYNTTQPIFRVRRDDLMVACIHYRTHPGDRSRISRMQARLIASAIRKAVSR